MGRLHLVCLRDAGKIYTCVHCGTHLALNEDIVSKSFNCKHGKAYLFNKIGQVGVIVHLASMGAWDGWIVDYNKALVPKLIEKEDRLMLTGMHTVADIFCVGCGSILGWKYEIAHEKCQKYKEGKFILERSKVVVPDCSHHCVTHEVQSGESDEDDT